MKPYLKVLPILLKKWQQLRKRDRQVLIVLGIFLVGVLLFSGLWQPQQLRLAAAERLYQQRLALAMEVQRALPARQELAVFASLSSRLSDSAQQQGLDLQQVEIDDGVLRITLRGNVLTLLKWLESIERYGAVFEYLSLEKSERQLEARLVVRGV